MDLKKQSPRIALGLLGAVVAFLGTILVLRTLSRGDDFQVFHGVAQRFWDGVRPYDTVTFGNMVFKYPPWILPFFLPFGFLDLETAKIFWGLVEVASLVAIVVRIHGGVRGTSGGLPGVRPWIQSLFLLILFGLFGSHGMTGQITLLVLALAVWADPVRSSFRRFFFLVVALSAKMTSLFPLVYAWRRKKLAASVAGVVAICVLLSLPIYFRSYDRKYGAMRQEWVQAMFSGTQDVNSVRIGFTTREVQGLPSLILRKGKLDENEPRHVLLAIAFSVLLIGGGWIFASRRLPPEAQWFGWIALLPTVQPLAWFHVFLFAYPVLAIGAERAIRRRRTLDFWLYFACVVAVGGITAKTLGPTGLALEHWSIKLWGTLGAVALFARSFAIPEEISGEAGVRKKPAAKSPRKSSKKR